MKRLLSLIKKKRGESSPKQNGREEPSSQENDPSQNDPSVLSQNQGEEPSSQNQVEESLTQENEPQDEALPQTESQESRVELPSVGLAIFECVVCYEHMMPPYMQCVNGHMICQQCLPKVAKCTICRENKPHIRVRALENLVELFLRPCKNAEFGCKFRFLTDSKRDEHETDCDYKILECPCPRKKCKWSGRLPEVITHFSDAHKSIVVMESPNVVLNAINAKFVGEGFWMMVQKCYDKEILLTLSKKSVNNQCTFTFIAQLIGGRSEAQKFYYKVKLQKGLHQLEWKSPLATTFDTFEALKEKCLCFELSQNQMNLFAEKKDLVFKVSVIKENEAPAEIVVE